MCCECRIQAANSDDLREHHASVHGQLPKYSCADCPKIYSKYSTFLSHVRSHRTKLKFCCDICWKWFRTCKIQETHRAGHGDERPFGCATCGKRLNSKQFFYYSLIIIILFQVSSAVCNVDPCSLSSACRVEKPTPV